MLEAEGRGLTRDEIIERVVEMRTFVEGDIIFDWARYGLSPAIAEMIVDEEGDTQATGAEGQDQLSPLLVDDGQTGGQEPLLDPAVGRTVNRAINGQIDMEL